MFTYQYQHLYLMTNVNMLIVIMEVYV